MKIRNGFVSNSSSSSFIIRGIKVKEQDLVDAWKLDKSKKIQSQIRDKCRELRLILKENRNYFDTSNNNIDDYIIGIKIGEINDGDIQELGSYCKEDIDLQIQLESVGLKVGLLSYFLQYVSNDNC